MNHPLRDGRGHCSFRTEDAYFWDTSGGMCCIRVDFHFIHFSKFFKNILIYLLLAVLSLCCCTWASSSFGERGLLSIVESRLQQLRRVGSVVVAHGLPCSCRCRIFLDKGSHLCLLHWQADSYPLYYRRSPPNLYLYLFLFSAVLRLSRFAQAFSSCDEQGLLFIAVRGSSLKWLLLPQGTGLRTHGLAHGLSSCSSQALESGSGGVGHGLSCFVACGTFPDHGSDPCPLHWQVDPYSLYHQGSPSFHSLLKKHLLGPVICQVPR